MFQHLSFLSLLESEKLRKLLLTQIFSGQTLLREQAQLFQEDSSLPIPSKLILGWHERLQ